MLLENEIVSTISETYGDITNSVSWLTTFAEDSVECEASENLWWASLFKKRNL